MWKKKTFFSPLQTKLYYLSGVVQFIPYFPSLCLSLSFSLIFFVFKFDNILYFSKLIFQFYILFVMCMYDFSPSFLPSSNIISLLCTFPTFPSVAFFCFFFLTQSFSFYHFLVHHFSIIVFSLLFSSFFLHCQ